MLGGGGRSQGRQAESERLGEGLADNPVETWETLSGSVFALDDDELTIEIDEGRVTVHLGPEWYWDTEGITLAEGGSGPGIRALRG